MSPYQDPDTAVVVNLDRPVADPTGRGWSRADRLVGIVRNGHVVTVCLSRKHQVSKLHFRVQEVR